MTLRYGDGNEVLSGDTVQYTDQDGDRELDCRFTVNMYGRDYIHATDGSSWSHRALQDMTLVSRKDAVELLPEPDWSKPLEHFCVDDKGRVLARFGYGRWMPTRHSVPTISDWLNEAMWHAHPEHQHHVASFVACGLRALCGGWAPCGCWQRISLDCVSFDPCQKHGGSFAGVSRKRVAPQITGYTRAKQPTWDDIRPGQVWKWEKPGHVLMIGTTARLVICQGVEQWLLNGPEHGHSQMLRSQFDRGEWTLVSDIEPHDTIPCPPTENADLQPGIPGEPTYADHRQRYLDAILRGERVHDSVCACWHCRGCDAGQWSPWDHDEAERKIAMAETAAKAIGYSLWTWGMGGRTEGDHCA